VLFDLSLDTHCRAREAEQNEYGGTTGQVHTGYVIARRFGYARMRGSRVFLEGGKRVLPSVEAHDVTCIARLPGIRQPEERTHRMIVNLNRLVLKHLPQDPLHQTTRTPPRFQPGASPAL
jgi:hypothetical protein